MERLTLHLSMVKYYVQAINYSDSTIRLVDAAVQKDDCFSIPNHSLTEKDTSSCKNGSGTTYNYSPSCVIMEGHSYVLVGGDFKDVPDLCRVNLMYAVQNNMTNMSYTDIHDILADGFELKCTVDPSLLSLYAAGDLFNLFLEDEEECIIWIACRTKGSELIYFVKSFFFFFLSLCFYLTTSYCHYRYTTAPVLLSFLMLFLATTLALISKVRKRMGKREGLADGCNGRRRGTAHGEEMEDMAAAAGVLWLRARGRLLQLAVHGRKGDGERG
ncbi:hypothetical protein SADUNF_Sadunf17G0001200 [Salix dunnii]|uniref:Uncharacterized protein n=1 Tax=Salix dunnii TaxID=1413687 RepID=A0A835MGT4_9ROSI|nr:hypothetical protein SADUNF_Sadunf17G0001200 [Salix dunnii]